MVFILRLSGWHVDGLTCFGCQPSSAVYKTSHIFFITSNTRKITSTTRSVCVFLDQLYESFSYHEMSTYALKVWRPALDTFHTFFLWLYAGTLIWYNISKQFINANCIWQYIIWFPPSKLQLVNKLKMNRGNLNLWFPVSSLSSLLFVDTWTAEMGFSCCLSEILCVFNNMWTPPSIAPP